jgi:serine phosphatase RsbU (regulator of sigma subunit)
MKQVRGLTLARINEITIRINSAENLNSLLTVIMDTAREFLASEASSLLLYDPETDELIFDVALGSGGRSLTSKRIPAGQGIAGACARERSPIVVNNAATDARLFKGIDQEIGFVTRNLLAVPMMAADNLIGVLEVLNTADSRDFDRVDVKLLSYLSNMAALAIRNRQLFDDVRDRMVELNCIYEISESVRDQDQLDELLEAVLAAVDRVLGVSRLSVIFREGVGARIARTRGFTVAEQDLWINPGTGVSGLVFRSGDPLLVRDIAKDLRMLDPPHRDRYGTRSFVSVPMLREGQVVGVLNAADKRNGEPFDYFELKVLSTIASQVADACTRILARDRERELAAYRRDLETAALIQQNSLPRIPALVAGLEVATRYEACKDVGGDFYDLVYHSEDRVSLVMADVAGKGVPAALFMEYSKTLLASQIPRNLDPITTLAISNRQIYENSRMGIFVTCMLVQVERDLGRLRLASAGHNHQILWRRGGEVESLSARGRPLGIFEDSEYEERVVNYSPGDLLLLYTDGITEANNQALDEFGEERLFELFRSLGGERPATIVDRIFADMNRFRAGFEASDDATMMVVRL